MLFINYITMVNAQAFSCNFCLDSNTHKSLIGKGDYGSWKYVNVTELKEKQVIKFKLDLSWAVYWFWLIQSNPISLD